MHPDAAAERQTDRRRARYAISRGVTFARFFLIDIQMSRESWNR